ncbi:hypothetical protein [Vibrio breoganii]|uniref:hypothetical protein n=1 Tax=Vibrio breoganii TaxID=553239 RepID=UPI000C82EBF5|nr:hypothetical protein [Vibrio breoganii]PMH20689.1 hypothetical protein BCU74_18410 [Vibrio breoganii]PMM16947.1 hypothetical protein BCT60_18390 [Vibrio breoganii]
MSDLEDALESYFLCGSKMNKGKDYLTNFMEKNGFSASCIDGVLAYLVYLQKTDFDIQDLVEKFSELIIDFQPCSQIKCECSGRLKLEQLIEYDMYNKSN